MKSKPHMVFNSESVWIGDTLYLSKEDCLRYLPHLCQFYDMAEDHSERMQPYEEADV